MQISEKHSHAARENLKKAWEARKKNRINIICLNCGESFSCPQSYVNRKWSRKFCSRKCRYSYMVGKNAPNFGPNKKMQGKRNPNWKGGDSTERQNRYKSDEVNRWRRLVYRRDNFTCQRCGFKPNGQGMLRAHHIIPWKDSVELRFDVNNGITLCVNCHRLIHLMD